MKFLPIFVIATTLLAGCATTADNPAKREFAQKTIPTCKSERECELKWFAARRWVLNNSAYKIKTITADFLETYSATGGSSLISVRVSKEPVASGGYRIVVGVWCDNMFGCNPDAWDAAIAFNREVTSAFQN